MPLTVLQNPNTSECNGVEPPAPSNRIIQRIQPHREPRRPNWALSVWLGAIAHCLLSPAHKCSVSLTVKCSLSLFVPFTPCIDKPIQAQARLSLLNDMFSPCTNPQSTSINRISTGINLHRSDIILISTSYQPHINLKSASTQPHINLISASVDLISTCINQH